MAKWGTIWYEHDHAMCSDLTDIIKNGKIQKDKYFAVPLYALIKYMKETKKAVIDAETIYINLNKMVIKLKDTTYDMRRDVENDHLSIEYNDVYIAVMDYFVAHGIPSPDGFTDLHKLIYATENKYSGQKGDAHYIWNTVTQIAPTKYNMNAVGREDRVHITIDKDATGYFNGNRIQLNAQLIRKEDLSFDLSKTEYTWSLRYEKDNIPVTQITNIMPETIGTLPQKELAELRTFTNDLATKFNTEWLPYAATQLNAKQEFEAMQIAFQKNYEEHYKKIVEELYLIQELDKVI